MMTQEDFKQEVVRIRPQMVQTARRYLDDADEAEDTVQDVLLRLWQMTDTLRLPLDALAEVLTRNFCIDTLRRRKPQVSVEQMENVADDTNGSELLERTMRMIEALPAMQQTIIRLRHMEGMEMKDIAALTGSTEVAVRKALSRARRALAQKVMNHSDQ